MEEDKTDPPLLALSADAISPWLDELELLEQTPLEGKSPETKAFLEDMRFLREALRRALRHGSPNSVAGLVSLMLVLVQHENPHH